MKIKLNFANLSDAALVMFAESVIAALTGNPNFPTPSPTLASVATLKDNLVASCAAASDGGRTLTALKNGDRKALIDAMRLLASHVEDNSGADLATMLSSGFGVNTFAPLPRNIPPAPQNLRISDGDVSGSVIVRINAVRQAVVYELRYTADQDYETARWQHQPASTSSVMLVSGITPGDKVWVQVRALNSKGAGNWCTPARFIVR